MLNSRLKRWGALVLAGVMAFSVAGCGSGGSGRNPETEKASEEKTDDSEDLELSDEAKNHSDDGKEIIGISMPAKNLPRWNWDGEYLKKYFEEAGYTANLTMADNKIDTQIDDIHNLINEGVDVLLIAPVDGTKMSKAMEEAKAADVMVISYDRIIEDPSIKYYVSFDNQMCGTLQGEFIRDALDLDHAGKKTYNMEIVAGYSADKNADGYYYGAHDVLEPYIKDGVLKIPSGQEDYSETETFQWSTDYAEERLTDILTSYYSDGTQLDAVLVNNDSAAVGVDRALQSAYKGKNKVIFTGLDGDSDNLKSILDGRQTMTVYKCLQNETRAACDVTLAVLNKEKIDEDLIKRYKWDFDAVFAPDRYSNGTDDLTSYLLTPIVITKDNLQEELIDTGFYKMDKDGVPHIVEAADAE